MSLPAGSGFGCDDVANDVVLTKCSVWLSVGLEHGVEHATDGLGAYCVDDLLPFELVYSIGGLSLDGDAVELFDAIVLLDEDRPDRALALLAVQTPG